MDWPLELPPPLLTDEPMYKLILCWRYLSTRYIALASVISVTLGVATMIVVNSVMSGFAHEMKDRIHGILSDVIFESHGTGFDDPEYHMDRIRDVAGDYIAGMTPTVHVPAMLTFEYSGKSYTRPVTLIGIDEKTQGQASDFGKYLLHPGNREKMSFELRDGGFDTADRQDGAPAGGRSALGEAGWSYRRWCVERKKAFDAEHPQRVEPPEPSGNLVPDGSESTAGLNDREVMLTSGEEEADSEEPAGHPTSMAADPFQPQAETFDPAKEQHTGLVLGVALSNFRDESGQEQFLLLPGDDVRLTFPNAANPPGAATDWFTIVDLYESKMSEYDSTFVFVPIQELQKLRGTLNPQTNIGDANSIQIRLKDERDAELVRDKLRQSFAMQLYSVSTWRDKQGPLLAAVQMETSILNILLFLIIAVAGFGILAIFFMIVIEKTRDIGVLKALGASGRGIMGIFLSYGLSLGMVGSGVGMVLGLMFVTNINQIAKGLSWLTGHEVFDPSIYYFYKIPTIIEPWTVTWIVCGAMLIAVMASVLPARRAARLHPVEALRYE
ncbi:MAG TPA: ABC transporter permease [Pirellulales bacterium]|nr:ABC transporter permease [Pirellulales bacterium]